MNCSFQRPRWSLYTYLRHLSSRFHPSGDFQNIPAVGPVIRAPHHSLPPLDHFRLENASSWTIPPRPTPRCPSPTLGLIPGSGSSLPGGFPSRWRWFLPRSVLRIFVMCNISFSFSYVLMFGYRQRLHDNDVCYIVYGYLFDCRLERVIP